MADLDSFSFGDSPALADELLEARADGKEDRDLLGCERGLKGSAGKRWIVKGPPGPATRDP